MEDDYDFNPYCHSDVYDLNDRLLELIKTTFDKAKAGDPHAQLLHARHIMVFADNDIRSLYWLKEAYEGGDAEAAYILGCVYTSFQEEKRRGVPKYPWYEAIPDDSYAYLCFSFAAEKGDVRAMAELGRLLTWGAGCDQDIWEADKWFKLAQGRVKLPKEAEILASSYSDGEGNLVPSSGVRICQLEGRWEDEFDDLRSDNYSSYYRGDYLQRFGTRIRPFDEQCEDEDDEVLRYILDGGVFVTVRKNLREYDRPHVVDIMIPKSLRELIIPEEMTCLAYGALAGLQNLERVTIPSDWLEIGEGCFFNCPRLRSITLPDSLEAICRNAFGCDLEVTSCGLSAFHVPKGLTRIAWDAFGPGAMAFERFTCDPENPEYMEVDGILYSSDGSVIVRCPQGRQGVVEVPKSVEFTNEGAFTYCDKLTRITFLGEDTDPGPESAYVGCSESLEKDW